MNQPPPIIRLSFAGTVGEPATVVDFTIDFSAADGSVQNMANIDEFIAWSLQNDVTPRATITEGELDRVSPVQVFRKSLATGPDDDKSCLICQDEFRPRRHVRRLPCGHLFCSKCVGKWLVHQSSTCPTCRCSVHS